MSRQEELQAFLDASEDLINGKYILADIKLVSLLKAIAQSEALLALLKNSLVDFDYEEAKKKYLVKSKYFSGDKGEFILPESSREILALVFNVLMDIDSKRINLGEFLNRYFYEDGSFSSSYTAFSNSMIRPFSSTVKLLMTSVIEGKLQDPIEALAQEEEKRERQREEAEKQQKLDKELSLKAYGESLKQIKDILFDNKVKIKNAKIAEAEKEQMTLVVDMFANALDSQDKDSVIYAYVAYKYMLKVHAFTFVGVNKKVSKLLQDVINGL